MGDWKRKLIAAVRPYIKGDSSVAQWRLKELHSWLVARGLTEVASIGAAKNVVELMELIDRWHDEDVAKQPCAAPAPPANPFLAERVVREIKFGDHGDFAITGINYQLVKLRIIPSTYTPPQLRALAKQLTDLADAHEAVYPPQQHPYDL